MKYFIPLLLAAILALTLATQPPRDSVVQSRFSNAWHGPDKTRSLQWDAINSRSAEWGHWGARSNSYSNWTSHSNRLIPVYTFGISLDSFQGENSVYRHPDKLKKIYGRIPSESLDERAEYFDQTEIYRLQMLAREQGKKYIILVVFDGMDWQTTRAAAIYNSRSVTYTEGRGSGLAFQDYDRVDTDFGFMVTSPTGTEGKFNVDGQVVTEIIAKNPGGYDPKLGGFRPWEIPASYLYLIGEDPQCSHGVTDSASSATSMTCGKKTYNGAINVDVAGNPLTPIARQFQQQGLSIGMVTSVPISHATVACAYANNVSRNDYQDLTRDLLGLSSVANRRPLTGVDVLIGCGWGEVVLDRARVKTLRSEQGQNFMPGNKYVARSDWNRIDVEKSGKYRVVARQTGVNGADALKKAAASAADHKERLFGFFGTRGGHLPYATADGDYRPTRGISELDVYIKADVVENPTLVDMTEAALKVLEKNDAGFWLLVEPGDVDWANHNNNIDDSIGAVLSGDAAFRAVCQWAEKDNRWKDTAVIVAADHGHLLVLEQPDVLIETKAHSDSEPTHDLAY